MSDSFDESSSAASGSVTDTTTEGYGSRLGGSLIAALFGFVLVPAAIVLMYWNEGRAVDAIRALDRGAAAIMEVDAAKPDPAANGKLVHVTGMLKPGTPAQDGVFGVSGDGLVRLERTVEMFQWKEEKDSTSTKSVGGSKTTETTYKYQQAWSDQPISSSGFKSPGGHQNPPMPLHSATFDGANVMLGGWQVDAPVLNKLTTFTPLRPATPAPAGYQVNGEGFYQGQNPSAPAVGDVRVTFKAVPAQTVSVAAADASGVLTAWKDRNGYTIAIAEPGVVSAQTLFHDEKSSASVLTWILRGVGFVMVFVGFMCIASPLSMLFAILPFLESLVGAGVFLIALTLAVPVTLLTIAVAWIVHRPLIGVGLVVVALAAMYGLKQLHPKRTVPAAR